MFGIGTTEAIILLFLLGLFIPVIAGLASRHLRRLWGAPDIPANSRI